MKRVEEVAEVNIGEVQEVIEIEPLTEPVLRPEPSPAREPEPAAVPSVAP